MSSPVDQVVEQKVPSTSVEEVKKVAQKEETANELLDRLGKVLVERENELTLAAEEHKKVQEQLLLAHINQKKASDHYQNIKSQYLVNTIQEQQKRLVENENKNKQKELTELELKEKLRAEIRKELADEMKREAKVDNVLQ